MSSIEEKLRELEPVQIVIYAVVGVLILFILFWGVSSGSEEIQEQEVTELEMPNNREKVEAYESKLEAYRRSNESSSNDVSLEFGDEAFGAEEELSEEEKRRVLGLENGDSFLDDLLAQQEENDKKAAAALSIKSPPVQKEKEVIYVEKNSTPPIIEKKEVASVKTRFAIYDNQYVLPNDLVELMLVEDFVFQDKLFKANTFVYAEISIFKNRVLFDIPNIAHVPLNIQVRDIQDGRIGMRSERAGELWERYKRESTDNVQDDATEVIETGTKSRIIGKSLDALSDFFKRKKIRKSRKIPLLHDQELIVKITPTL